MQTLKLDNHNKLFCLFTLLGLPGNDDELRGKQDKMLAIVEEKRVALAGQNFDIAAEKRAMEIELMKEIVDLLNQKKLLHNNRLEIDLEF